MSYQELREQIESSVSIGNLIGTRANRAHCPFHNSSGLDLAIRHHSNQWRCFGACDTGQWRSIFDFQMEMTGCDFKEAMRQLADMGGIPLGNNKERVEILQGAQSFFRQELLQHPEAMAYLRRRGFSDAWMFQRQIGWCGETSIPPDMTTTQLEMVGLVRRYDWGARLYQRNRIIYPVVDRRNEIVNMQGRAFPNPDADDPKAPPKYLALPMEVDLKGRNIFDCLAGEDLCHRMRKDFAFMGEGWPDTETLLAWNLPAVGLFGHSGMERHAYRLGHLKQLFVVLDPDKASQNNIYPKLWQLACKMPQVEIRNIYLNTGGMDLNDWAMHGKPAGEALDPYKDEAKIDQLRDMVVTAKPLIQDLIDRWCDKLHNVQPVVQLIARSPDPDRWIFELSRKLNTDEHAIRLLLRVLALEPGF